MMKNEQNPFKIASVRGESCDKLIDFVVLAEFDIDTGSTVRHQYPGPIPGYKTDWFAEFMLPEGAHNRDSDFTYIFLNRTDPQIDRNFCFKPHKLEEHQQSECNKYFLYGVNLVKTKHDSSVRRGAIVKAICVFSRYHYVEALKKPLDIALEKYFANPSVEVLKGLFNSLNAVAVSSLQRPNLMEQCLMRRGVHHETINNLCTDHTPQSWYRSLAFSFEGDSDPASSCQLSIPLFRTPDEVGDISLTALVRTFGEATMRIFHSIIMRQRVLFVGYNHSASDVAQMVLSAVSMVAPPLVNIIHRTYPYANLSDLSFLEVKGYVSGVTNPMFQQRDTWWDLLCVLDLPNGTGTVTSAEERRSENSSSSSSGPSSGGPSSGKMPSSGSKPNLQAYEDSAHSSADTKFIIGVISGVNARLGEDWVRQQFYDYMSGIANHAQDRSVLANPHRVDDKWRKFVDANSLRVASLHANTEFRATPSHPWVWCDDEDLSQIAEHQQHELSHDSRSASPIPVVLRTPVKASSDSSSSPAVTTSSSMVDPHSAGIAFERSSEAAVPKEQSSPNIHSMAGKPTAEDFASDSAKELAAEAAAAVASLDNFANTAAALFTPPRKLTDRHKDNGSLMKQYVRKLQFENGLQSTTEVQLYFQHLDRHLVSEASLQALLVMLPESQGGLSCVAAGLFHTNPVVRFSATQILTRVQEHQSTQSAFFSLSKMFLSAFERQKTKLQSGVLANEMEEAAEAARSAGAMLASMQEVKANKAGGSDQRRSSSPAVFGGNSSDSRAPVVVSERHQTSDERGGSVIDGSSLSTLLQQTLDGFLSTTSGGEEYSTGFSHTIDELDMIP